MKRASLFMFSLAGSLLAQNIPHIDDSISTAEALRRFAIARMQSCDLNTKFQANATTTCTPPPPSGGTWQNLPGGIPIQRSWTDNFGQVLAFPGPPLGAGQCGQPFQGSWSCDSYFTQPLTPGSTLHIQGFFYAGSTIQITGCNGIAVQKATTGQLSNPFQMQLDENYVLHNTSNASHLVCNFSGLTTGWQAVMIEEVMPKPGTTISLVTNQAAIVPCGTSYPGISLNLTGTPGTYAILQSSTPFNTNAIGVSSPYTMIGGGNYAYWLNATNGNPPTWTNPPGTNDTCANQAIVFQAQ